MATVGAGRGRSSPVPAVRAVASRSRCLAPRAPVWPPPRSLAHRPALLAQITEQRVVATDVLPGGAAPLPPAEWLHPGPGAGGRAGRAVDVNHAGLDAREEGVDPVSYTHLTLPTIYS